MTIRDELREALSGLSLDNAPTPERQEKSYFAVRDSVWQVRTIADKLHSRHAITSDVFNSCQKWAMTYILLYDGPGAIQAGVSGSVIKHDAISFVMEQALRKDSIPAIREFIGKPADNLLRLSLYECLNAARIGEMLLPNTPAGSRNKAVDTLCKEAYEKLNEFYVRKPLTQKKTCASNDL